MRAPGVCDATARATAVSVSQVSASMKTSAGAWAEAAWARALAEPALGEIVDTRRAARVARDGREDAGRVVGGAVVGDDDLVVDGARAAQDGLLDAFLLVACGEEDRDARRVVVWRGAGQARHGRQADTAGADGDPRDRDEGEDQGEREGEIHRWRDRGWGAIRMRSTEKRKRRRTARGSHAALPGAPTVCTTASGKASRALHDL